VCFGWTGDFLMNPSNEREANVPQEPIAEELVDSLRLKAKDVRRNVLLMAKNKGDGYVGQGLGAADILTAVYFHELRFDAAHPTSPGRDRFVLSTGHYSIVLFAALVECGVLPREELSSYGADASRLEMSACETTPGVEITGGSLGHGLSQAVGMALGSRLSRRNFRVFNFLSDGELQEGATWEAAMAAANFKLDNLVAIVDINNMQADGRVSDVMGIEPVTEKWKAFGWHVQAVDGNSIKNLIQALYAARSIANQPKVLVCTTLMGKGVPFLETRPKAHFVRVETHEWDLAISELEKSAP
jgi:transketolase